MLECAQTISGKRDWKWYEGVKHALYLLHSLDIFSYHETVTFICLTFKNLVKCCGYRISTGPYGLTFPENSSQSLTPGEPANYTSPRHPFLLLSTTSLAFHSSNCSACWNLKEAKASRKRGAVKWCPPLSPASSSLIMNVTHSVGTEASQGSQVPFLISFLPHTVHCLQATFPWQTLMRLHLISLLARTVTISPFYLPN